METRWLALAVLILSMAIAFNLGHSGVPTGRKIHFYAPAITDLGKGSMIEFEMQLMWGEGRTLVNIQNADFKDDVENALRKARFNAGNYLGISNGNFDAVLSVKGEGSSVSGESAGGMFAVALIALQTGRNIRQDAAISALITQTGELKEVGGIEEKIIAARENHRSVFLVSASQKIKDESEVGRGIRIIRVSSLGEAVKYLIE